MQNQLRASNLKAGDASRALTGQLLLCQNPMPLSTMPSTLDRSRFCFAESCNCCAYSTAIERVPSAYFITLAGALHKSSLHGTRLTVRPAPKRQCRRHSRVAVQAAQLLGGKKVNKVVLAYSGGLDTSVILTWLKQTYDCEVVTFTADLGQVTSEIHACCAMLI